MRPGQIDIKEEEQDAETEYRWVELVVIISRQPIEEKMPVNLILNVSSMHFCHAPKIVSLHRTNLRLDEHQIDEEHHKVVLHIFVRKPLASRTLR